MDRNGLAKTPAKRLSSIALFREIEGRTLILTLPKLLDPTLLPFSH